MSKHNFALRYASLFNKRLLSLFGLLLLQICLAPKKLKSQRSCGCFLKMNSHFACSFLCYHSRHLHGHDMSRRSCSCVASDQVYIDDILGHAMNMLLNRFLFWCSRKNLSLNWFFLAWLSASVGSSGARLKIIILDSFRPSITWDLCKRWDLRRKVVSESFKM